MSTNHVKEISVNDAKGMTLKYKDVNPKYITPTQPIENKNTKSQKIAFVNYVDPINGINAPLTIQCPQIELTTGCVPRIGEYFTSDAERAFIKPPLDPSNPTHAEFLTCAKSWDEHIKKFGTVLFGKHADKYTYVPFIREPYCLEDDDNPNKSSKQNKLPYFKAKIDVDYNSGEIKTKIYEKEGSTRVEKIIKNIDDFSTIACYLSKVRLIIRCVKIWIQPLTKKDPSWGATFKIVKIEVEPPIKNSYNANKIGFISDSDSDEETLNNVSPKSTKKVQEVKNDEETKTESVVSKSSKKVAQVESDDSDNEEESKPLPVVTKSSKKVAQVESDDSDSEEEKSLPVVTKSSKKVAQVESDDSDSEDEKPPPPIKKPVAKNTGGRGGKAKSN